MAKPILDLLAGLEPLDVAPGVAAMEALGYEYLGEYGIPGREFFRKGGDRRTHHVHAVELGGTALGEAHRVPRLPAGAPGRGGPLRRGEASRCDRGRRRLGVVLGRKEAVATDIEARALAWAADELTRFPAQTRDARKP